MKTIQSPIFALFLLLASASIMIQTGCAKLAPGGVYQGDKTLFEADRSIVAAYEVFHAFVSWEHRNRATLSAEPSIKHYADYVRKNAESWINSATALRDVYALNPTADSRNKLSTSIQVLNAVIAQASVYLLANPVKPSTP